MKYRATSTQQQSSLTLNIVLPFFPLPKHHEEETRISRGRKVGMSVIFSAGVTLTWVRFMDPHINHEEHADQCRTSKPLARSS